MQQKGDNGRGCQAWSLFSYGGFPQTNCLDLAKSCAYQDIIIPIPSLRTWACELYYLAWTIWWPYLEPDGSDLLPVVDA